MKAELKYIAVFIALLLGGAMLFITVEDDALHPIPSTPEETSVTSMPYISPLTLSEWIIEGRRNYLLIDIRAGNEYDKGGISGAVNAPLSELMKKSTMKELSRHKILVLYDTEGTGPVGAVNILRAEGFNAYMLDGGMKGWEERVLNPAPPSEDASDDEYLIYAARLAVSNFYKGKVFQPSEDLSGMKRRKFVMPLLPLEEVEGEGC